MTLSPDSPIYVAGHTGMVGSALVRALRTSGHRNLVLRASTELDLRDQAAVHDFLATTRPAQVYLAAAKVGGIHANTAQPADFLHDNLAIQTNVILILLGRCPRRRCWARINVLCNAATVR